MFSGIFRTNHANKICLVMLFNNNANEMLTAIKDILNQSYHNFKLFVICDEYHNFVDEFNLLSSNFSNDKVFFEKITTNHYYGYVDYKLQTLEDDFNYFTIVNSYDRFYPNFLRTMVEYRKPFVYANYHTRPNSKIISKQFLSMDDFINNYKTLPFVLWSTNLIKCIGKLNFNSADPLFDFFIRSKLVLRPVDLVYVERPLGRSLGEHRNSFYANNKQLVDDYRYFLKNNKITNIFTYSTKIVPSGYFPLVIMPTYNRASSITARINMMISQSHYNWNLVIIDDGSTIENKTIYNEIKKKYSYDKRIIFLENDINRKVPYTLNKGIKHFFKHSYLTHLTWISDDNNYYTNYLSDLLVENKDFIYSSYDILNVMLDKKGINRHIYKNYRSLLKRFDGCASFMWSKQAIKKIGFYNEEVPGCEDYEYLLRTFRDLPIENIYFVNKPLMTFIQHSKQGTEIDKERIFSLKDKITNKFIMESKPKISIVMGYFNRKSQTIETLKGFEKMYVGKYDFEVIIVDDNSNDENKLEEDIKQFTFPINLIVINAEEKGDRINPCITYNKGFSQATGDVIIIQNPECYHYTNLIDEIPFNELNDSYFTSPVLSSPTFEHNNFIITNHESFSSDKMIDYLEKENLKYPYHYCKGWYNHPSLSLPPESRHLHFCSVIHRNNLDILMGFDENYKDGTWYDDNEFLFRIKKFLKCSFLKSLVIHQFHEVGSAVEEKDESLNDKKMANKTLYDELLKTNDHDCITWNYSKLPKINYIRRKKKHGIGISVFSDNKTHSRRVVRSCKCIRSIVKFFPNIPVFIVIDGSITDVHFDEIKVLINDHVKIVKLPENKGISYVKNVCIDLLKDVCDYIYLLDDDIEITKYDFDVFIENVFNRNNIPLISNFGSGATNSDIISEDRIVSINGIKYYLMDSNKRDTYFGNLIIIDRKYLPIYGYFHELKHKWGYEHLLVTNQYLKDSIFFKLCLIDIIRFVYNGDDDILHLHSNRNIDYNQTSENVMIGEYLNNVPNHCFHNNLELFLCENNVGEQKNDPTIPGKSELIRNKVNGNTSNFSIVIDYKGQKDKLAVFYENINDIYEKNYIVNLKIVNSQALDMSNLKCINEFEKINTDIYFTFEEAVNSISSDYFFYQDLIVMHNEDIYLLMVENINHEIYDFIGINRPISNERSSIVMKEQRERNGVPDIMYIKKELLLNSNFIIEPEIMKKKNHFILETDLMQMTRKFMKEPKISIVMASYNRKQQTVETLKGFEKMYAGEYDFEIIIVDDDSDAEHRLDCTEMKRLEKVLPIRVIRITKEEKGDRINPCLAYNRGFMEATGDIILFQNPECYHVGDILEHILDNLCEQDYFSYSCFTANSSEITNQMINSDFKQIQELLKNEVFMKKNKDLLGLNWYNHNSEPDRQTFYHFCSAIYKNKLDLIGGFDSRFANGYCFDDDEILLSIKYNLKLNMSIIDTNCCFVIHQYHTRNKSMNCEHKKDDEIKLKWEKNKNLYKHMKELHERNNFSYPKLLFLYWDGSPLSYLNYLTVVSFNYYNPGWKIIVYVPTKRTTTISWKGDENKMKYEGVDHFNKLYTMSNVIIQTIDLNKIGFYEDASEVIKSDYFRYYVLEKHGGLWSDFDIIYTACIEDKMNFTENTVIFKCPDVVANSPVIHYFPIGLFLCKPTNKIFKYIKEQTRTFYNPDNYQSIGAIMWNKLFRMTREEAKKINIDLEVIYASFENYNEKIHDVEENCKICNNDYYLPCAWNELSNLLGPNSINYKLPPNNIGIHWFNGAKESKQYSIELENRLNNLSINCLLDFEVNKHHKKISIVMAYYNRKVQTLETLKGFQKMYIGKYNFEVVIVDDNSNDENRLEEDIKQFSIPIKLIVITNEEKGNRINPCAAYNRGFSEATGDIIVIQNPEIYHCGDIIEYVLQNSLQVENNYVTFPVFSSPSFNHNTMLYEINDDYYNNFVKKINYKDYDFNYEYYMNKYPEFQYMTQIEAENDFLNYGIKYGRTCNKEGIFFRKNVIYEWKGWYNHCINNPRNLHFLSVISKDNLNKIGGFCNKFKYGLWYDDDDFLNRIKKITNVITLDSTKYFGIHQHHLAGSDDQHIDDNFDKLVKHNKDIFEYNQNNNIIYCSPNIE